MRRLVIFRHSKARAADNWDDADHARPLSTRGKQDAPLMGRYLAKANIAPDLALVSDSMRTRETFDLAAAGYGKAIPLQLEEGIYEESESWGEILRLVRGTDDGVETLMVVGHNPSVGDLAAQLSGYGDRHARAAIRAKFPTSAIAIVEFDVSHWGEVRQQGGRLAGYVTPATLGGGPDDWG